MGKKRITTQSGSTGSHKSKDTGRKSAKKTLSKGIVTVFASYNNTIVTVTDLKGAIVTWSSAGSIGFKGTKKSTPYAATLVAKDVLEKAKNFGLQEVRVVVTGIGAGRDGAIRGIAGSGINILAIRDNTPQPHNGVKAPKPRRV